ncbi:MAG: hypothetical protein KAW45_09650, partial [Thermoplasmatales archaeon]|nr:hypothetical protein [Thermoplasmatales archaeon]
ELMSIRKMDTLMKLRLIVGSIFALSTLSIILVFITDFWLPGILILFSYIMLCVLTIKLFIIRKL